MKAKRVREVMQDEGKWVNWERTADHFLAGNPELEVTGIAVSWMPTFANLKKAFASGCNLFVTHEHLFAAVLDEEERFVARIFPLHGGREMIIPLDQNDVWAKKKKWLDETGMVVYRCHDFWDDFPDIGIHGAWADWLGFAGNPVVAKRFYEVHEVESTSLKEMAEKIAERVKPLGQDAIQIVGDPEQRVSRIALGTGAITEYRQMYDMNADVLLLTDDGTRLWESGQWALDAGIPLIILNHATSEEPGMITLAKYIQDAFPTVPVKHIPVGCLYKTIT